MSIHTPTHDDIGALVPLEQGRDYAVEAQDQAKLLDIKDDLHKFFMGLFEMEKRDEKEWLDVKKQWVKCRNYFDGKQFGRVNDALHFVDYELRAGEQTFMDNAYHPHVQTALTELTRSTTKLNFSHISPESRIGQLVARIAEARYAIHKKRTFTSLKMDQEHLSLLLNGLALRYTYWNKNGRKEKIPTFGEKPVDMASQAQVCAVCGSPMEGQCANCGSTETTEIASQGFNTRTITGYEEYECGETEWESVDPLGITFYLHAASLKDTPYLIWKQDIVKEVLQASYPDIKIYDGSEARELEMKSDLDSSTPNDLMYADGSRSSHTAEFVQGWFRPALYANRVVKQDTKLRNGMVLKANTKLGQYFPDGLYLAKNVKNILDVYSEEMDWKWTCAPYVSRLGTMIGAGTSVALANQDIKNDLRNLHMRSIYNDSFNKEFVNVQYLEGQTVPNDPTERAVVTNLPEGMKIVGNVIDRLPGSPLSADAYALEERIDASMQVQLGTFSAATSESMPDAAKNTATGYLTWRNTAVGRYAPMLGTKADALDREQAYQFLENDQKYLDDKEWEKVKGDYGSEAVMYFKQCDLKKELVIEVSPESWTPKTQQDRRAEKMAFFELMTTAQIDPGSEWGGFIGQDYEIPKDIVGLEVYKSIAYDQIFAFKEVADEIVNTLGDIPSFDVMMDPVAAQIGQLIVTQANKPIDAKMEDFTVIADTFKDYWASDAGRQTSNAHKASIKFRMMEMDQMMVAKMQEEAQLQMAAQAPMMEAQMAMQNAQGEQQAGADQAAREAEQQNAELETEKEAVRTAIDAEREDKKMAHEQMMSERQMQYEAEEKQKDREHALLLEKERAKNKPAPKK